MRVTGPSELELQMGEDKEIDMVLGNFGRVPYGQDYKGIIFYDSNNNFGCKKDKSLD
jgi:hypothetical protein